MAIHIRKWATFREEILSDGGRDLERPLRRVAVAAVVLLAIVVYDLVQRRHALLRNFPVIGHFRYLLEVGGGPGHSRRPPQSRGPRREALGRPVQRS